MKTAIDSLIDNYFGGIESCTPAFRNLIEIAKQEEKMQMSESFYFSAHEIVKTFSSDMYERTGFEKYYNEKFNTK